MWSGSPLWSENHGALLSEDELVCYIGNPAEMEAVVFIDQADRQLVKDGLAVDLKLESDQMNTYEGKITDIAKTETKYVSKSLSSQSGGQLDTEMDPKTGRFRPISTSYQAHVPLNNTRGELRAGFRGWAKVHTEWKTLGWRAWRIVARTFNFEL